MFMLSRRTIVVISRAITKFLNALILFSLLVSSTVGVGTVHAQGDESTASSGQSNPSSFAPADQATYSPPKLTHPAPRFGERPVKTGDLPAQISYPTITCEVNCTQLDSWTIVYSGSGSAVGQQVHRPPIGYRRGVQAMRVYYLFKGLRVTTHNYNCGLDRNHDVRVEAVPGVQFYFSPVLNVPANGYQEFIIPTINTYVDHSSPNRSSSVSWFATKSGISCDISYTYTVDRVVISSKPIDMTMLYDGSTGNLAQCTDGDCETGAAPRGATGTAADPVNTRTGAFSHANADLSIPTSAGNLVFERSYSSATVSRPGSVLGSGWTHNHGAKLIFSGDPGGKSGYVIFRGVAGNDYLFKDEGNNTYTAAPGVTATLTRTSGPPVTYAVKTYAQSTFNFNSTGRLTSRQDDQGHAFAYTYDGSGKLAQVSADSGSRYLDFAYDAQGRIESVTDHADREVTFTYDAAGDLVGYTDVLSQEWEYTYDSGHRLTEIVDPTGKETVRNEYEISSPPALDFDNYTLVGYGGQNGNGSAVREDNGATLHQTGNSWVRINYPYTITANTVLEFDYKSTAQAEIQGIGFDNNDTFDNGRIFELYGTDTNGKILAYYDYAASAPGWKHYQIKPYNYYSPAGFAGSQSYLFFVNDHDFIQPAAQFVSASQKYMMSDSANLDLGNTSFTWAGWVRPDTLPGSHNVTIVSKYRGPANEADYHLYLWGTGNNKFRFDINNASVSVTATAPTVSAGNWYYVVAWHDAANDQIGIQINNGTVYTTSTSNVSPGNSTNPLYVGWRYNLSSYYWNGRMDELGLWTRVLTSTERTALYNSANGLVYPFPSGSSSLNDNLLSFWKMDEVSGTRDDAVGSSDLSDVGSIGQAVGITGQSPYPGQSYFRNIRISEAPVYSVARQYNGEGELTAEFQYNPDRTTTFTDALGNETTHTYDMRGTLVEQTDPLNGDVDKTYNANFRPKTITDPAGDITTLTWTTNGANLTRVVDAEGNQTDITYDSLNNPTSIVDPRDFLTSYTYNGPLLTSETNALNQTTTYTYTTEGNLASVTDALNHTTTYTYDSHGQRTSMTDALNKTWTYAYDNLGRLVDTTDPLDRVTHNEFDVAGQLIRVTQNYDPARVQNEENQWNIITEYEYDVRGNLVSVTDTLDRVTEYTYDDADRLISTTDPDGNVTSNIYNTAGQLTSTTDALGRVTTYSYDDAGRLLSASGPLGSGSETTYNPDETVASTTDALGRVTSFAYDSLKRVTSVTQPNGGVTQNAYDALGNLISTTDPLGKVTSYTYDALNRLIRETDALGGVTEHFYDAASNMVQTIDPRDNATTYEYDATNRLISVTDALGNETTYVYDELSRRTAMIDANGGRTEYTYDGLDRVEAVADPLNHTSTSAYDALGNVLSQTDPNSLTTSFTYDLLNQLTAQTDELSGVTSFTFDDVGNRLTITDPNIHTTNLTYDALNRATAVTDPNGNTVASTYDVVGNLLTSDDGLGNTTSYEYNALNQPTVITDPLGHETHNLYNSRGELILTTDAEGIVTKFEHDVLGRLTAVVENYQAGIPVNAETNVRTEYTYDANGNRLTITDGNDHVTTFTYDALNRVATETDSLNHTWTFAYDDAGNRVSMVDANGATTAYLYDNANRLTNIDYPGTAIDVAFTYDAGNRRLTMTDGLGTTTWEYDDLGRATAITDPFDETVEFEYDAVGNRTELTYPSSQTVAYTYDPGNRLTLVNGFSAAIEYAYDDADRLIGIARPNNINTSYAYDDASRLLSITHAQGVELLSSFQYTYDDVGNRIQALEDVKLPGLPPTPTSTPSLTFTPTQTDTSTPTFTSTTTETYTPTETPLPTDTSTPTDTPEFTATSTDTPEFTSTPSETPTETLIPTNTPTFTLTPSETPVFTPTDTETPTLAPTPTDTLLPTSTFTPSLTPTSIPSGPLTITYIYDPLYRLIAADYSDGKYYHYAYDSVGNRLTEQSHVDSNAYTYDDANRLTSVSGVSYSWDANGNLLSDGVSTYTYDAANRLSSVNADNTYAYNGLGDRYQQTVGIQTTTYVLDLNAGLTQVLHDGVHSYTYGLGRLAQIQIASAEYFLDSALGSVRQLSHQSGVVTLAKAYDPYGNVTTSAGIGTSVYGYSAEQTDATNMIYLRARYYMPGTGRFVTRDSWEGDTNSPLSLNHWAYVEGNPINYTDPTGHCPKGWKKNPDGSCTFDLSSWLPFGGGGVIVIPEEWEGLFCEDDEIGLIREVDSTPTPQQSTPTPMPGTPEPDDITSTPQITPTPQGTPQDDGRSLTAGERVHLNRIMTFDVSGWIAHHKDAPREYRGWHNPKGDHAGETLERISMLENSVAELNRALRARLNQAARVEANQGVVTGEYKKATLFAWLVGGF